jgi:glycosyltransferase involved in cell wall biosynthesis
MKIVLDLQSLQTESRYRGIGRYSLALARAMISEGKKHDFIIILNHNFPDTIAWVKKAFEDLLPQENILTFSVPRAAFGLDEDSQRRYQSAELIREYFIEQLKPDWVHVSSLFEDFKVSVTSVGCFSQITTATTLYNLIPYLHQDKYLANPVLKSQYFHQFEHLMNSDLILTLSEQTRIEAIETLHFSNERVINIFSDTSIVPEVIRLDETFLDQSSITDTHDKLHTATNDDHLCKRLIEQGKIQSSNLFWKTSARSVLQAMKTINERKNNTHHTRIQQSIDVKRPRLAYLSPLPPEKSGIADYSADLLPELSRYYEIDLVTDLNKISDPWLETKLRRISVAEFKGEAYKYDRVLYHFGNSEFHSHMFSLLAKFPGTVVLHDFFLSNILHYLESINPNSQVFRQALYSSHGYPSLLYWRDKGALEAAWKYPCSEGIIKTAQGVIVHSKHALQLAERFFSFNNKEYIVHIPLSRHIPGQIDRVISRKMLGLTEEEFLVCSFGILNPTKLNDKILSAWLNSNLSGNMNCHLIFVGNGHGTLFEQSLLKMAKDAGVIKRVKITGYVSPQQYRQYLASTDIAVQLRTQSRGETSASALDCLSYGIATVVNKHGSMSELPEDTAIKLHDQFSIPELAKVLEELYIDPNKRRMIGQTAKNYVKNNLDPMQIAKRYFEAIESFAQNHPIAMQRQLISKIVDVSSNSVFRAEVLADFAENIAENTQSHCMLKLLVDISVMVQVDLKTGIQRVVRSILQQFISNTPIGFRVEPVYRSKGGYYYAHHFMLDFLGIQDFRSMDTPVDVSKGDIFLELDLDTNIDELSLQWLQYNSQRGLKIYYVIYDILPLIHPEWFLSDMNAVFKQWIDHIATVSDGLIGISRATAEEIGSWLNEHPVERIKPLQIDYFHLGADIEASKPTEGLSSEDKSSLDQISNKINFLMVGTVEPRKGYQQVLEAFEQLWNKSYHMNLVIIGKQSFGVKDFIQRLTNHPQKGKHLFWFDQASDELLLNIYSKASALLMASEGEGFGLPLIEAAKHGLPIIARDLPVFREVAGNNAFYFSGTDAASLASALEKWLDLFKQNKHPTSQGIKWLTWAESAEQLKKALFNPVSRASWDPQHGFHWNNNNVFKEEDKPENPY